jgi:branched-chain amino acid transport system substrate-binding protein
MYDCHIFRRADLRCGSCGKPVTASGGQGRRHQDRSAAWLTGAVSDEAKKQEVTFKMWLEKVNAAGGINVGGTKMKVQLVTYDYQSDGQRAAQLADKLITDDKVDVLFSPFGSGHTKIVATIAARYEIPIIACAASSESVFDQNSGYLFGTLSPNAGLFTPMVKYFQEKMPGLKKLL